MNKNEVIEIIEQIEKIAERANYESEVLNSSFFLGKRDGLLIAAEVLKRNIGKK